MSTLLDAEGRYVYTGPSLHALWGLADEEVLGADWATVGAWPELVADLLAVVDRARSTGQLQDGRADFTDAHGHYEYTLVPLREEGGALVGFAGPGRDQGGVLRAVPSLAEARLLMESLTEGTRDVIVVMDTEHRLTLVNPSFRAAVQSLF